MKEQVFFDVIRNSLFGGKLSEDHVAGIKGVVAAMDAVGDGDQDTLAYALATDYHETGARMVPVREGFAKTDAGARKAVAALARKRGPDSAVARYSKPAGPYGHVYYGRGHAQLTWLENYESSSADAGVDLVKNPDAMLDPVISARVLICGIMDGRWNGKGKGIDHYEGDDDHLSDAEAADARRTVNGKDKAVLIAGYHRKFFDALDLAGWQTPAATHPTKAPPLTPSKPAAAPAPAKPARAPHRPPSDAEPPPDVLPEGSTKWVIGIGGVFALVVAIRDTLAGWWQAVTDWLTFWN